MEWEIREFEDLRQLAIENVWIPLRPWNLLRAPGGFPIFKG
jgi:hypothetical protein